MDTKASPIKRILGRALALALAGLILWGLYSLPYDEIRADRTRAMGEYFVMGQVVEKTLSNQDDVQGEPVYLLAYRYVDDNGFVHHARATFTPQAWEEYDLRQPIPVLYARANPAISRARGEDLRGLRAFLRSLLDDGDPFSPSPSEAQGTR